MSAEIKQLQPAEVWECFYELTQIPRPSKHEERITAYMKKFGEDLGLETHVDAVGNVIIRKPATPGMEDRQGIVLQGHLDMVPQKNNDIVHDFLKDPIDAYVDGEWVKARGTTLGADNGIGAAAAMAVLRSKTLKHGSIEALFTIDEETGMTGAFNLQPDVLKGDILMNLDSESEGELYVGCAGGIDGTMHFPIEMEPLCDCRTLVTVSIKGLLGGHSGMDIILGRGNSVKLMARMLNHLQAFDPRIVSFEGGSLRNAIPREAEAVLAIRTEEVARFIEEVAALEQVYKAEFALADKGVSMKAERKGEGTEQMVEARNNAFIWVLMGCPNGVIRMSNAMPGLVETSTNLACVKREGDNFKILCLLRSSVDTAKTALAEKMKAVFSLAGASAEFTGAYPGWNPNMDSAILKTMKETYQKEFGKEPEVMAIHAGLECGLLGGVYPKMDMISFGPTIMSPHSPDERVNIESVGKFWYYLCKSLENAPRK